MSEEKPSEETGEEKEEILGEEELGKLEDIFEHLYEDVPMHVAKMASRKEREENGVNIASLTYGEILFHPFAIMFKELYNLGFNRNERAHKFVDIGCGSGRPVFAAALLHRFDKCIGIEILENLYNLTTGIKLHWDDNVKTTAPEDVQATEFEFHHADALELDWKDADVVFINSTCFDDELLNKLSDMCSDLKKGAMVITTTKPLPCKYLQCAKQVVMDEAWGSATTFLHRKYLDKEE